MAAINELFGNLGFGGMGNVGEIITLILIALITLSLIGSILFFFYNRKKWNLKVEFKLPRSVKYRKSKNVTLDDLQGSIESEWGKGYYNTRRGVVFLKRKGKKKISMKPFNVNKYLQGQTLTVVQAGAIDYIPVMPESYLLYVDDETNEECALLEIKTDTTQSKPWKSSFERETKQAFSIVNILREYAPYLAIGLVILLWGIQLMILYNKIK